MTVPSSSRVSSGTARWRDRACLAICIALSSAWCLTAGSRLGVTFDEPSYVATGLERWRTGSLDPLMRLGTLPLAVDVMTLPIHVAEQRRGARFDIAANARGDVLRLADLQAVLPLARASILAFWMLLLGYAWLACRAIAGPLAGNLAVAFLAVEPSLLAHASLATTDIALAACLLALGYYFRDGSGRGWGMRVALPGLWFGLATLAKASALVFGPLVLIAVWLERLSRAATPRRTWHPTSVGPPPGSDAAWRHPPLMTFARDLAGVIAIGLAIAIVYCGSEWHAQRSFVQWAHELPDGAAAIFMRAVAGRLTVFSNAGEGLVRQIAHNVRGHGVYILGYTAPRAVWYYFPLALTMKLSAAALIVCLLALFGWPRLCRNWLLFAAGMLLCASVAFRVQIGIRLVLPLLVFVLTGTAAAIGEIWRAEPRRSVRAALGAVAIAGVGWTAVDAALTWPDAIRFTNELWGGTARGYLRLSDSNYDWGQGLPSLRAWQKSAGVEALDVWYWGTDPGVVDAAWRVRRLHELRMTGSGGIEQALAGRYLAASTTLVYGSVLAGPIEPNEPDAPAKAAIREIRALLRARAPVAHTSTFLIYDFTAASVVGR